MFSLDFVTYAQEPLPEFQVTNSLDIFYEGASDDFVRVREGVKIRANSSQYFLPAQDNQEFEIYDFTSQTTPEERSFKKDSLRVYDRFNRPIEFQVSEIENGLKVTVPDGQQVSLNIDSEIYFEYKTYEYVDLNGNITNLYIPGLAENTQFETIDDRYDITTAIDYTAQLHIPESMPPTSYLKPTAVTNRTSGDTRIYTINAKDRIGTTAWIQLGTEQYYYFRLEQQASKTDLLTPTEIGEVSDYISTNIYTLPLPKNDPENAQEVYIKNITPTPRTIERDDEGNIKVYFETPANESTLIVVEGYISLSSSYPPRQIPDMPLNQYLQTISTQEDLVAYTKPDLFWETQDAQIQQIARDLSDGQDSILELVRANYDYIINEFDYSYAKINDNERLGALAALNGSPAVCMEYADATIALLRAQGIPARAVVGYGNDPTGAENEIGSLEATPQNIGHQWLQVWIPDYGWMSLDPTWGESDREYIGGNLDHILWYTIGSSDQDFLGTSLNSADRTASSTLKPYDIYLRALDQEEFNQLTNLEPINTFLDTHSNHSYNDIELLLKTTQLGRAVIMIGPIIATFSTFAILFSTIKYMYKRTRRA